MKMKPLFLVLFLFIVTSCSSGATSSSPTPRSQLAYPAFNPSRSPTSVGQAYPDPSTNTSVIRIPKGSLPTAPASAPAPLAGKASINGILFDFNNSMVLPLSAYYLMPATGPDKKEPPPIILGPHAERGDISSFSDKNGLIALVNVPPGNYFMAVPGAMDWRIIQKSKDDQAPLLIQLKEGQGLALGVIYIP